MAEGQSSLVVKCPACSAAYRVPATAAGKRITCKKCQGSITVPATAGEEMQAGAPPSSPGRPAAAQPKTAPAPRTSSGAAASVKTAAAPDAKPSPAAPEKPAAAASGRPRRPPGKGPAFPARPRPGAASPEKGATSTIKEKPRTEAGDRRRPSQKKIVLVLAGFVLVLLVSGVGGFFFLSHVQQQREVDRHEIDRMSRLLKEGEELIARGDFKGALVKFEQVMESKSRVRWDGRYYRARWNFAQGKYREAVEDATEAANGGAGEGERMIYAAENFFLRARARIALGQYTEALKDIDEGFRFKEISTEMSGTRERLQGLLDANARVIATLKEKLNQLPRSASGVPASPDMFEQCIAFDGWDPVAIPAYAAAQKAVKPDLQVAPQRWPAALLPLPIHGFLGDLGAVLVKEYAEGLATIVLPVRLAGGELGLLQCLLADPKNPRQPVGQGALRLTAKLRGGRPAFVLAQASGRDAQTVESADALPSAVEAKRQECLKSASPPVPDAVDDVPAENNVTLLLTLEGVFSAQAFADALDAVRRCEKVDVFLCMDTPLAMQRSLFSALGWLVRHQGAAGLWNAEEFDSRCRKNDACPGTGQKENDEALTGLVLLALLGSGADLPLEGGVSGRFSGAIQSAKESLKKLQKGDGCFEPATGRDKGRLMFTHAVITTALAQAAIGGDSSLKEHVSKAVDFILAGQADAGGWGYKPKDAQPDVITTGWCAIALRAAEVTGKAMDAGGQEKALKFLLDLTDSREFNVKYQTDAQIIRYETGPTKFIPQRSPAAHALVARLLLMPDARAPVIAAGGNLLAARLPNWDKIENVDLYHWLMASAGLYLLEGREGVAERKSWDAWSGALVPLLLQKQNTEAGACLEGSWDAVDKWGWAGGRPYSTAAGALALEILLGHEGFLRRLGR